MIYLDKGSGYITGSQHSAECTELHRGQVEDWCRFVIGPAFLLHMFCYICSRISKQSNYHSLLFEQQKKVILNCAQSNEEAIVDFENANSESNCGKNATIWLFSLVNEI